MEKIGDASDHTRIPIALDCQVRRLHSVFEKVVLLNVTTASIPYIDESGRFEWSLHSDGHSYFLKVNYGFMEFPDVPKVLGDFLQAGVPHGTPITYVIGRETFDATSAGQMSAIGSLHLGHIGF